MPWNNGFFKNITATRHPSANMSTGAEYVGNLNKSYGARYHLVDIYYVKGGILLISFAIPKSIILTFKLSEIRIFSGFKSLWKNPCLCVQYNAYVICLVIYLI